jgi:hypothetical protein
MRLGHIRPAVVIDAKRVRDLSSEILQTDAGLRIGAGVTMTMLVEDPRVRRHFPALVEAAAVVGSIQIRNRATLAGNICNASPAADTVPALLVYGAVANLVGSSGSRRVPLTDFFTGPGRTVLSRDELVQSIDRLSGSRRGGVRPYHSARGAPIRRPSTLRAVTTVRAGSHSAPSVPRPSSPSIQRQAKIQSDDESRAACAR